MLLVSSAASYFAQFEQGMTMLGLSGGYYNNGGNTSFNNSTPGPSFGNEIAARTELRAGFFISKKIMTGLQGSFSYNENYFVVYDYYGNKINQNVVQKLYGLGVFVRGYQMLGEGRAGLIAHLRCSYLFGTNEVNYSQVFRYFPTYSNSTIEVTGLDAAIVPGIVFFPTKRIGVEASFGSFGFLRYVETNSSGKSNSVNTTNMWNLNYGLVSTTLGLHYYFGGPPTVK